MATRRKARRAALELLYQVDLCGRFTEAEVNEALDIWRSERELGEEVLQFVAQVAHGVREHLQAIDSVIAAYARDWTIERMAVVDRNILRLALYEMLYRPDIPASVAINEAVELAKRYGDVGSKAFINGILAAVKRDLERDQLKGEQVCPPK